MNDIAKPIMNVEKCLRRISDQIAHGNMTSTQLFITHHAILDAIANLLDAKAWVSDRLSKHTEEPNQIVQPDETRYAHESGLMPDSSQKCQQSELGIQTLQTQVVLLQIRVAQIEDQLPQLQKPHLLNADEVTDIQRAVDGKWQEIRERAEAEIKRKPTVSVRQFLAASRSLKVD